MSKFSLSGRPYQRLKTLVLTAYGHVCWECGHGQADSIDHVIPLSWGLVDPYDLRWWRPSHWKPCPTCRIACNSRRQARPAVTTLNTSRRW